MLDQSRADAIIPGGPAWESGPVHPDPVPLPGWSEDWPLDLEGDVRPVLAALHAAGTPFARATIVEALGGPRPVGSQMVVTAEAWWGFLSGGCVEADLAARAHRPVHRGALVAAVVAEVIKRRALHPPRPAARTVGAEP